MLVTVETSIPASIFYTTDGTEPTTSSNFYFQYIKLPTNQPSVTLKLYATNGTDSSAVITNVYAPSIINARRPGATVDATPSANKYDMFPYGSNNPVFPVIYGKSGGITVDAADVENIPDGYDGTDTGTYTNGTDLPKSSYSFIYSDSNSLGEKGKGIGNMPGKATVYARPDSPNYSNVGDDLFNPRALVIFMDSSENSDDKIPVLNRSDFAFKDMNTVHGLMSLTHSAWESSNTTGNFVKQFFNHNDQTMTYYYRDSNTNQWIISKNKFTPNSGPVKNLSNIVFASRNPGDRFIHPYMPYFSRKIF